MKTKHYITSLIAVALLGGLSTFTTRVAGETQAALLAEAKITQAEAEKIALAKIPDGTIKNAELEKKKNGKLVWSVDVTSPKSKSITKVQVNARNGKILSTQAETPEEQAKEAAPDKGEQK